MYDYLSLLPSTLQWLASLLDKISPISWPLWLGGLFPLYVGAVASGLWFMRGAIWPVLCAYPVTSRGRDCQNAVPGEWRRCRHHNREYHYMFRGGHRVQTKIRRWQRLTRSGDIVDRPAIGVGAIRTRPAGQTILYYTGYARNPIEASRGFAMYCEEMWQRAIRLRTKKGRALEGAADVTQEPMDRAWGGADRADLAYGLDSVVGATRASAITFGAGLLFTVLSIPSPGGWRTTFQYLATLAFVVAWAAVSAGVFKREYDWRQGARRRAIKWWLTIFVPVGVMNLYFAVANGG